MSKMIRDGKGRVIGWEQDNGTMLDGKGHYVGRYNEGSDMTLDRKGRLQGFGDQRLRLLDNDEKKP